MIEPVHGLPGGHEVRPSVSQARVLGRRHSVRDARVRRRVRDLVRARIRRDDVGKVRGESDGRLSVPRQASQQRSCRDARDETAENRDEGYVGRYRA